MCTNAITHDSSFYSLPSSHSDTAGSHSQTAVQHELHEDCHLGTVLQTTRLVRGQLWMGLWEERGGVESHLHAELNMKPV